jgi:hypothetical protein
MRRLIPLQGLTFGMLGHPQKKGSLGAVHCFLIPVLDMISSILFSRVRLAWTPKNAGAITVAADER